MNRLVFFIVSLFCLNVSGGKIRITIKNNFPIFKEVGKHGNHNESDHYKSMKMIKL